MHPVVTEMLATQHRAQLLDEAAATRRVRTSTTGARSPAWRSVPARALVALARVLDPRLAGDLRLQG